MWFIRCDIGKRGCNYHCLDSQYARMWILNNITTTQVKDDRTYLDATYIIQESGT